MSRLAIVSCLAAALLAGCVVGPRYHAPVASPGASGAFVTRSPALAQSEPLPPYWWRLYDDPVLDRLVLRALSENSDLKVAAANLAYAQAQIQEALAARFPSTGESVGGAFGSGTPPAANGPFFAYTAGFSLSYEVDLFGRVRKTIQAARENAQAQAAAEDQTRVTVAAGVASAYANACGLAQQLAVARRSLSIVQRAYDLTKVQRDAGALSDFDLDREAVLLDQTRALIPQLVSQRRAQLFTLAALLGLTPREIPAEADACAKLPTLARPLPVGDGAAFLRRRPDLREAERNLAAAVARIAVATAELYPTITLGGSVTDSATQLKGLGNVSSLTYSVGPLITWSFPNLVAAHARVREAGAQASAALASFDGAVLNALRDVEQALTAYASELDHNQALRSADANAEAALKLANVQFTAGAASFLDILSAEQTAVDAAQAAAASDQQIAADQVAVFQALGGGWEDAPAVKAPVVR